MKMKWIPAIEVESAHGTREVSLTTRHLMNRTIFLNESTERTLELLDMNLLGM